MAIHVSCPSCRSEAAVDDGLAGKDVLCPHCQQRITVPSLAGGAPAPRRAAAAWDDDADADADDRANRAALPRYHGVDDDDVIRDRRSAWGTTASGLWLIFLSGAVLTVLSAISNALTMALGSNPQNFALGGAGGAPPRPEMMAFGVWMMLTGCATIALAVVGFVGMCMCCTAPAASGAKGKAIGAVATVVLIVVGFLVLMGFSAVVVVRQVRQGGAPPQPGQMPFGPAVFIAITVAGAVAMLVLVALWMLFHKAVADHFRNPSLARASVWYIVAFAAFVLIGQFLNVIANPQLLEGNLLAPPPNRALALAAQGWWLVGLVALSIWLLLIVRETRRTILEHEA